MGSSFTSAKRDQGTKLGDLTSKLGLQVSFQEGPFSVTLEKVLPLSPSPAPSLLRPPLLVSPYPLAAASLLAPALPSTCSPPCSSSPLAPFDALRRSSPSPCP